MEPTPPSPEVTTAERHTQTDSPPIASPPTHWLHAARAGQPLPPLLDTLHHAPRPSEDRDRAAQGLLQSAQGVVLLHHAPRLSMDRDRAGQGLPQSAQGILLPPPPSVPPSPAAHADDQELPPEKNPAPTGKLMGGSPRDERARARDYTRDQERCREMDQAQQHQHVMGHDCPVCGESLDPAGRVYDCGHPAHHAALGCCLCHYHADDSAMSRRMQHLYPGDYTRKQKTTMRVCRQLSSYPGPTTADAPPVLASSPCPSPPSPDEPQFSDAATVAALRDELRVAHAQRKQVLAQVQASATRTGYFNERNDELAREAVSAELQLSHLNENIDELTRQAASAELRVSQQILAAPTTSETLHSLLLADTSQDSPSQKRTGGCRKAYASIRKVVFWILAMLPSVRPAGAFNAQPFLSSVHVGLGVCPSCVDHDGQAFMMPGKKVAPIPDIGSSMDTQDGPSSSVRGGWSVAHAPPSNMPQPPASERPHMCGAATGRLPEISDVDAATKSMPGDMFAPCAMPPPPGTGNQTVPPRTQVPAGAAAARALAFQQLEEALAADSSPYALDPGDREALHKAIASSQDTILAGIPRGTLSADSSGVKWAIRYCLEHNTPFIRPLSLSKAGDVARESFMYARMAVETATHMSPRSKNRRAQDGRIITDAKPGSALGPLYAWRRILRDGGCELPPLGSVKSHMKGLVAEFKLRWGPRALIPQQRFPFSLPHLRAIESATRSEQVQSTLRWSTARAHGMRAGVKWGLSSGARADELTHPSDYIRRSNFVLFDGNRETKMTIADLRNARNGQLLRARTNGSKTDRDDMEWGGRDMWFKVNSADPLNFAYEWIQWELAFPCTGDRSCWAAFSPNGGEAPFATSELQRDFNRLMEQAIGSVEAALRSWHALRVTAASALGQAKKPDGVIQCVIRWKTVEAMRLYNKMDRDYYADVVDEITRTSVNVTTFDEAQLPAMGHYDTARALDEALAALDLDEHEAAAQVLDGAEVAAKKSTGKATTPKKQPTPAPVAQDAPSTHNVQVDCVEVEVYDQDKLELTGAQVDIHNTLWPWEEGCDWDSKGRTLCTVLGECVHPYDFGGSKAAPAYVIECDEENYAIKTSSLKSYFPALRKRKI